MAKKTDQYVAAHQMFQIRGHLFDNPEKTLTKMPRATAVSACVEAYGLTLVKLSP